MVNIVNNELLLYRVPNKAQGIFNYISDGWWQSSSDWIVRFEKISLLKEATSFHEHRNTPWITKRFTVIYIIQSFCYIQSIYICLTAGLLCIAKWIFNFQYCDGLAIHEKKFNRKDDVLINCIRQTEFIRFNNLTFVLPHACKRQM